MKKFTHPFNKENCIQRLLKEAKEHDNKLIIAFDFDNTIFDCHNLGGDYSCVIDLLKKCTELNFIMILYSVDEDDKLLWKKEYCNNLGIKVDYINEDPIFGKKKPYCNIMLDDRCGLEESYYILSTVIEKIDKNGN